MSESKNNSTNHCLRLHYWIVILLYVVAFGITYTILALPEAQENLITILSSGAILATFGSAISSIALIWQNDMLERVRVDVDILYKDILKQDTPWRRWPFLARLETVKLYNGECCGGTLKNPQIDIDIGTHIIKPQLPTVFEDFFDLPLVNNYWQLFRFKRSAYTFFMRKLQDDSNLATVLDYQSYKCMYDIWKSIFIFRFARYFIHLGAGLTIAGVVISVLYAVTR